MLHLDVGRDEPHPNGILIECRYMVVCDILVVVVTALGHFKMG